MITPKKKQVTLGFRRWIVDDIEFVVQLVHDAENPCNSLLIKNHIKMFYQRVFHTKIQRVPVHCSTNRDLMITLLSRMGLKVRRAVSAGYHVVLDMEALNVQLKEFYSTFF